MKKLLLTLLCIIGVSAAWAQTAAYTVPMGGKADGATENFWPNVSAYNKTSTSADGKWENSNYNNNNNGWAYGRLGGKAASGSTLETTGTLSSTSALSEKIGKIEVSLRGFVQKSSKNNGTLDKITVESATNADFSDATVVAQNGAITEITDGDIVTLNIASPEADRYYRVNVTVTNNTANNGVVEINSFSFYEAAAALTPAGLKFDAETAEATMGQAFTAPTLTKDTDATIVYSSSDETVATVDAATGAVTLVGAGTTVITATTEATSTFEAGTASYTLTVKAAQGEKPAGRQDAMMYFTPGLLNVTVGEEFTEPVLSKATDAPVLYTSSNEAVATVDPITGKVTLVAGGFAQIKATAPATATFLAGEAFYILNVTGGDEPTPPTPVDDTVTLDCTKDDYQGQKEFNVTESGVTFTGAKGTGTSQPQFYGGYMRLYANNTLEIKAEKNIKSIKFVLNAGAGARYTTLPSNVGTVATQAQGDTEINWTGDNNSVTFTVGALNTLGTDKKDDGSDKAGQILVDKIIVNFAEGGDTPTPPTPGDGYASLAEWNAAKPTTDAAINAPLTAVYQNGKDLYVTQDGAYALVYGQLDNTYNPGDVIPAGATGKYEEFNGQPEFVPVASTFAAGTPGTAVAAKSVTPADITIENVSQYVRIEGAAIAAGSKDREYTVTLDGVSCTLWNRWSKTVTVTESSNADIYGFIGIAKSGDNTIAQLYPVRIEDNGDTPNPPTPPTEETVDFNWAEPTTLSDPFEKPASGEGVELDGKTFTAGPISVSLSRGSNNSNAPRVFTSAKGVTDLRFYGDNTATVSGDNVTITKIEFVCQYPSNFAASTADCGTFENAVWTGEAGTVNFNFVKTDYNPACTVMRVTYKSGEGSVENVEIIEDLPVEYYTLQGVRVNNPAPGQIVIRRQGNNISKILVK